MAFALSQEGDTAKLFISKLNWNKPSPLLENETVTVKLFGVWMEASFDKVQQPGDGPTYLTVRLRNQTLPLQNLIPTLIEKNPLKKFKWVDKDKVLKFYYKRKRSFNWKHVKGIYTADDIWSNLVEAYANDALGVVEVDLGTDEFHLKYEELANGFCFTFYKRSKLVSVCNSIKTLFTDSECLALQDPIKSTQSYATKSLQADFKAAGNVNRMVKFLRELKKKRHG